MDAAHLCAKCRPLVLEAEQVETAAEEDKADSRPKLRILANWVDGVESLLPHACLSPVTTLDFSRRDNTEELENVEIPETHVIVSQ